MADLEITRFQARFRDGVRPNLFKVTLHFPPGLTGFTDAGRDSELLVKGASLPQSTLPQIEVPYLGRQLKIPGDRIFPEWTITVFNHQDFALRDAFESWMNVLNSHLGNVGAVDPANYFSDAEVEQLDRNGDVLSTYLIKDMWPSEVSPIELSYDSSNAVEEYTVTLQYHYWEKPGVTT